MQLVRRNPSLQNQQDPKIIWKDVLDVQSSLCTHLKMGLHAHAGSWAATVKILAF